MIASDNKLVAGKTLLIAFHDIKNSSQKYVTWQLRIYPYIIQTIILKLITSIYMYVISVRIFIFKCHMFFPQRSRLVSMANTYFLRIQF